MALEINIPGIKRDLIRYFKRELKRLFKIYTGIIHDEIEKGSSVHDVPDEWKEAIESKMQLLPVELAGDVLYTKLGYPFEAEHPRSPYYRVFRIYEYGHAEPIWTKPGEQVWGEDIFEAKHLSPRDRKKYPIPHYTITDGSHFLENAFKRIEERFDRDIQAMLDNMPPGIVLDHIVLSKGSW